MLCIQRLWSPDRTSPSKNVIRSCFINIQIQSTKKITRILAQVALSLYLPFSHSGVDMRGELSTLAPLHTPPTPLPLTIATTIVTLIMLACCVVLRFVLLFHALPKRVDQFFGRSVLWKFPRGNRENFLCYCSSIMVRRHQHLDNANAALRKINCFLLLYSITICI